MSRPGIIDTGTVLTVSNYTGEGQLVASGDPASVQVQREQASKVLVA